MQKIIKLEDVDIEIMIAFVLFTANLKDEQTCKWLSICAISVFCPDDQ